jgi:hypothetical protein
LLALKLLVRSRYSHIADTQASGQKQVLPHCWHSSFRSETDIFTTAGAQAIVQGRNRYCHIASTQASGQKQIWSQLLALKQQFKAETGILPHCWHSSFRSEAEIVTTAGTQAAVQVRNRYCHFAGTQASG